MKTESNRRRHKRLKIDKSVRVPVQIFPILPFLGESIEASLINISAGGMALVITSSTAQNKMARQTKMKVHFRLPGRPLTESHATISHNVKLDGGHTFLGIRFTKTPSFLEKLIEKMCSDNDRCDIRIHERSNPRCEIGCAFYHLCRKPLRLDSSPVSIIPGFEIAFQHVE